MMNKKPEDPKTFSLEWKLWTHLWQRSLLKWLAKLDLPSLSISTLAHSCKTCIPQIFLRLILWNSVFSGTIYVGKQKEINQFLQSPVNQRSCFSSCQQLLWSWKTTKVFRPTGPTIFRNQILVGWAAKCCNVLGDTGSSDNGERLPDNTAGR